MSTVVRSRFHLLAALALAATVLVGFGRTFYLMHWFDVPVLSTLLFVHGVVFTGWLALHFTQARLIASHRVAAHKRLGVTTAVYGYGMFVLGVVTALVTARAGRPSNGFPAIPFLSVSLITIVMFAGFLTAALLMRRRSDWHKRLMLLATMSLLAPATARISLLFLDHISPLFPLLITASFVAWCWLDDWKKLGKVHKAYVVGGLLLMVSLPLRFALMKSDTWVAIATWLVS